METESKVVYKREWVKNAAIIFLAALLVLTFFSNTILNRSLPEAATKPVTSGQIVAKVRGSGTVEANGAHEVKMKQTKEIRSVMVKVGDEVKTGDVLFVLGAGDSDELEAAKETLRDLQWSYQRAAIGMPDFDYTSQNRALTNAENAFFDAEDVYYDALDLYEKMYDQLKGKADMQGLDEAEAQMTAAYDSLIVIQQNYDLTYQELSAYEAQCQQRVNDLLNSAPVAPPPPPAPEPPADTEGEGEEAAAELPDAGLDTAADYDAQFAADTAAYEAELAAARQELSNAQAVLDEFVATNGQTLANAQAVYDSAKAKYDALVKYNEAIFYELVPYQEALDKAERDMDNAYAAYEDAWSSLSFSQHSNEKTLAISSIELQQINEKIQLQQEKVKLLSGETEDQILANVNGIVQSISATAGNTVAADTVICTIEVPDMGHTVSFSVTNEQARRLRTGDTATISNFYWGNEVLATLSNIRTDPKNPQSGKVLTFELEGDVQSGAEITLSVGSKSANYDLIVPNSAIKSDSNGSFVLAIEAKNSPLGSRYIAKRVSVEVLASDDNNSAVLAELTNGDFVITTSSAPVKAGDQVRLADG